MFVALLAVAMTLSFITSFIVARIFSDPIDKILKRIIADEISGAWLKYMKFAIVVVGVSAGVRIYEIEKYITPPQWDTESKIIELTSERWILELYRTVIESLQGIAWLLLVFFAVSMVAYVIVRIAEMRGNKTNK